MLKTSKGSLLFRRIICFVAVIFAIISMMLAGFFTVYIRVPVNGLSMYPTFNQDQTQGRDIVYINRFASINRNDIIVLDLTKNSNFGNYIIKRLVAIEGDTVNIVANQEDLQFQLIVNNQVVDTRAFKIGEINNCNTYNNFQQYLSSVDASKKNEYGLIIGKNQLFVLGDNWDVSEDSARYGAFNKKTLVGRIDIVAYANKNELSQIFTQIF